MCNRLCLAILLCSLLSISACNPFAPAYDEDGFNDQDLLGDRTTLDGFFQYFKNSYELRDTSLYGKLFSNDFQFTYYDFDQAADVSWDKGQEMAISFNLFRNVQQITLDWNYYLQKDESDTVAFVVRSFNLTIVENENTIYSGAGRAKMRLRRSAVDQPWQVYWWFDDSDF
jgi:hypothetical protein